MSIEVSYTVENVFTHDEALMFCLFLEIDGKKGWRLPTWKEYNTTNDIWGWCSDDPRTEPRYLRITPVRDIDD